MQTKGANDTEKRLTLLAANQHGVVSLAQLMAVGLGAGAVKYRAQRGRLHTIHRGVYAVGHPRLSDEGRWMAAVLAHRPVPSAAEVGAVLSHRSAAALWRMVPTSPAAVGVDVTLPTNGGRKKRSGIHLHRALALPASDVTLRLGIPVTTPARTLMDLRRCVGPKELGRAWRQAEVLGYDVDDTELGARDPTRSELERLFLALCRRHRLPRPQVNVAIPVTGAGAAQGKGSRQGGNAVSHVVDFLWSEARLIVETDGYRYHRGRAAFEHDRRREADLAAAGYEVLRFTWRQVLDEPAVVAAAVRARLLRVGA